MTRFCRKNLHNNLFYPLVLVLVGLGLGIKGEVVLASYPQKQIGLGLSYFYPMGQSFEKYQKNDQALPSLYYSYAANPDYIISINVRMLQLEGDPSKLKTDSETTLNLFSLGQESVYLYRFYKHLYFHMGGHFNFLFPLKKFSYPFKSTGSREFGIGTTFGIFRHYPNWKWGFTHRLLQSLNSDNYKISSFGFSTHFVL